MRTHYCGCYAVYRRSPVSPSHPLYKLHSRNLNSTSSTLPAAWSYSEQQRKDSVPQQHLSFMELYRPNCMLHYTTNTSHCNQETFPCKYSLQEVFLPTKSQTAHCSDSMATVLEDSTTKNTPRALNVSSL